MRNNRYCYNEMHLEVIGNVFIPSDCEKNYFLVCNI